MSNDETIARLYAAADKGDVADFFRQYAAYLETQHILSPLRKRLHAMSRRAEAMAAEVERLRMSDEEHGAIDRALECARAMVRYQPTMRKCFELKDDAAAIEAVLARHTRETVGG
jgi:hypothetical protein